jgi:dynein heavy chain, axonemal
VACGNVAGLISWTIAMAQFYSVNKDVLPLKANLAVMQGKYQAAKKELEAAEAQLAAKEVNIKLQRVDFASKKLKGVLIKLK